MGRGCWRRDESIGQWALWTIRNHCAERISDGFELFRSRIHYSESGYLHIPEYRLSALVSSHGTDLTATAPESGA